MNTLQFSKGCSQSQKVYSSKDPPLLFVMMRFNIKIALIFLISVIFFMIVILYSICTKSNLNYANTNVLNGKNFDLQGSEEIDCVINGDLVIGCIKEGEEVYIPFSFLHRYFEVYGKLATYDGLEKFEWSHSYSHVHHPKSKYEPRGVYMYFENYNVEVRDRVKCVTATEGVPVSTQWESQGYYYPTQIAQFGLSHYSKNLTEPEPRRKIIDDGEKETARWFIPITSTLERVFDKKLNTKLLIFKTSENYIEPIKLKLDHVLDLVMMIDLQLNGNSSFTVVLQQRETKNTYYLHYITTNVSITVQDNNIYHGIGTLSQWKKITRDLIVDLQKGLNYASKDKSKHRIQRSKFKIISINLRGSGSMDNLTLSSSEHIQQFYDAADWFVKYQNSSTGGWPISVKRTLASAFMVLEKGWLSAMGQGQAISVLARAYSHSGGDQRYLNAAVNGLKPFRTPSSEGGVLAKFVDKFNWYEEYPTTPPSFVLNGFIFSLLGLYDLANIAPMEYAVEAESLYNDGLTTLKNMLPLFDMGSVTAYDLRHFTLGHAPNLARWDYHTTHISQLLLLSTIENEPLFKETAERWIGYMNGKRADHN